MSAPNYSKIATAAERYLRHAGRWVANKELAAHVGTTTQTLAYALRPLAAKGDVQRRMSGTKETLQWRARSADQPDRFTHDWPPGFKSRFFSANAGGAA